MGSSDLSIDAVLLVPPRPAPTPNPTPGKRNSVFATNAPPQIRQVATTPRQPISNQPFQITAKITDPDGVATVQLHYQVVVPGKYLPAYFPLSHSELLSNPDQPLFTNPGFEAEENWRTLSMRDDGLEGDACYGGWSLFGAGSRAKKTVHFFVTGSLPQMGWRRCGFPTVTTHRSTLQPTCTMVCPPTSRQSVPFIRTAWTMSIRRMS